MKLQFRDISPDEVEKELTQRDQFDSDEVALIEALVREAHQNSLDARPEKGTSLVRTRIAFHTPSVEQAKFLAPLLTGLPGHLAASKVDVSDLDFTSPQFLVIEDFGTTGLTGAWDRRDELPFSDFWRRVGKSHKGGTAGGRWGLGKLVFSSASRVRSFFGLTVRADDPAHEPLLMGQAVLTVHKDPITGNEVDGIGFFCERAESGLQVPARDAGFVDKFAAAVGISRKREPGLSIAIPFIRTDLKTDGLIRSLLKNYYFPILMGQLESRIDDVEVRESTFDELAQLHGGDRLGDGRVVAFVRELRARLATNEPDFTLNSVLTKDIGAAVPDEMAALLRTRFVSNELIHVRAPLSLKRRRDDVAVETYIDLFARLTDGEGQALVVRGGITLPLEGRDFRSRKCLAALIASDDVIAEFLGDAENPAHTKWNGSAEKLTARWVAGSTRLSEIRAALNGLYHLVAKSLETVEEDAFIELFSVPAPAGAPNPVKKPVPSKDPVPPIVSRPALYDIRARKGGFTVGSAPSLTAEQLPLQLGVEAAYNLNGGNPFKRHSKVDFDFDESELKISATGATYRAESPNRLIIDVTSPSFSVAVAGFDTNRDLVVRSRRIS